MSQAVRIEVRRARFGPGLWPGPRRQARWAGRGLQGQRRAEGASRAAGCGAPVEAGGASPDNARRSGPVVVTSSRRSAHLARACRPGRGAGERGSGIRRGPQRPVTGCRARQPPRRRTCGRRTRREAAAPQRRVPGVNPGRLRRVTLAAHSLSTARVHPRCSRPGRSGLARRRCALEAVEKLVTALRKGADLRRLG